MYTASKKLHIMKVNFRSKTKIVDAPPLPPPNFQSLNHDNSAVSCSISLKLDRDFECDTRCTVNVQAQEVKGQGHSVT